jgi:hypothetical protein
MLHQVLDVVGRAHPDELRRLADEVAFAHLGTHGQVRNATSVKLWRQGSSISQSTVSDNATCRERAQVASAASLLRC